ncbi:MAG: quinoprotein dehydrogenase-associated SoxYZ-like carrier [Gammaproteobacteria bacterium]|nr:quinoprotein dehydrogenase-associated SoxYZ-like carrier [Gammaproteobacteria bacterium]
MNINMLRIDRQKRGFLILMLLCMSCGMSVAAAREDPDQLWNDQLKDYYFEDKEMLDGKDILEMTAPIRAEDGAVVPVTINTLVPQTEAYYVKAITLLIDKNPVPMAGVFEFTPASGHADLDLRIRVNAYSPVRAIAETSDGKHYMVSRFVKASGGCSAPVGSDLDVAMKRLGKMRFKLRSEYALDEPLQMQLAVSHPNLTGLQRDQVSTLYIPPHFIKKIRVTFDGKEVLRATTDISISENPNLKFFFKPERDGLITAEIEDSQGMKFSQAFDFKQPG